MELLATVLGPVVWLMESILGFYLRLFDSAGIAILLLSFTFALALYPLQRMAQRTEKRISEKMKILDGEVAELSGELRGEDRFLATEKIYREHGYHPIHSVGLGASFFVMLPVLVAAIVLFTSTGTLDGESFLMIPDLSQPDGLLGAVNLLPLLMFAITVVDARLRFRNDRKSQLRFYFISGVLLLIVYDLASGLVLYWTGSNIVSLVMNRVQSGCSPSV